jgi:hypothetical protein
LPKLRLQELARSKLGDRPQSNGPSRYARYYNDPVGFATDVLGVTLWDRQEEILRAAAEADRFAVRSGHKVGKSTSAVCIALWFVCTRERARVILTAPTHRQIRSILWKELKRIYNCSLEDLGGQLNEMPENGLQFPDGREVVGFFTTEPEKMAGISGPAVMFIIDEASGYPVDIYEAIEGNRAGGAQLGMFSNPTMLSGFFYEAFHEKRNLWRTLHVDSAEAAKTGIPGLATEAWLAEKLDEWGEDSPLYQVRARGNFPVLEENTIISLGAIEKAKRDWHDALEDQPLEVGVDVARYGDDNSVICPRRGFKVFHLTKFRGDGPQVAGKVMEVVRNRRVSIHEKVKVKVDIIGVGASVYDHLKPFHEAGEIVLIAVNVAEVAVGEKNQKEYASLRTQLWFDLAKWFRDGGTIPADGELEGELIAHKYKFDRKGRREVISKDDVKKIIKRSPDKADALALAVFGRGNAAFNAASVPSRYANSA